MLANSGRATKNISLTWEVFPGAEHTRYRAGRASRRNSAAVATDFVNADFWGARRRPGRHSYLRSSSRAPSLNRVVARGKNLTTIYATHGPR